MSNFPTCSILLLGSMLACSPERRVDIGAFENRAAVIEAMNEWNLYLKEPFIEGSGGWVVSEGQPPTGYDGYTWAESRTVIILHSSEDDYERRVVVHEFGHMVGLIHSLSEKDMMFPDHPVEHLSPGDLEQCQQMDHCH